MTASASWTAIELGGSGKRPEPQTREGVRQILDAIALGLAMHNMGGSMQAEADAYTAVCLEPYSRARVLAGFSSAASQDAASETAALGGIATIDVGTERLVSKVCPALRWHSQSMTMSRRPRNPA